MPQHLIRVKDPDTGAKVAEIDHFLYLEYTQVVMNAGTARFGIPGDHNAVPYLVPRAGIEIWRQPEPGDDFTLEFDTILMDEKWTWGETVPNLEIVSFGQLFRLGGRSVQWAAGTTDRSKFLSTPIETIGKTLVDYNAGPNATAANGRKRDGTISGITIEADGGGGGSENWYCHGDNLLESLAGLAALGGGDFDLVKTAPATFEFRWYADQLGTDRSASAGFSMEKGNMGNPRYEVRRSTQRTVACVWGRGQEGNRDFLTVQGPEYAADNDYELYVDAKSVAKGDTAGLQTKGERAMEKNRALKRFTFDPLQVPSFRYGEDYFLGDLIPVHNPFTETTEIRKVAAVKITAERADETIELELIPPP